MKSRSDYLSRNSVKRSSRSSNPVNHLLSSPSLISSQAVHHDEQSIHSNSTNQDHSQISSQPSHRSHYPIRSATPSSSTSKSSQDELLSPLNTSILGELYLLEDVYPSMEHKDLQKIPLIFLGAEKFIRIRLDWSKVHYPLSAHQIEPIIDLNQLRPSFVREIPRISQLNLYRSLTRTIRG